MNYFELFNYQELAMNMAIMFLSFSYCLVVYKNRKKAKQALLLSKEINKYFREVDTREYL